MMNHYAALRKPTDGLVSRHLNRPISLTITRCLRNKPISPNQISIVTMLLGISSGIFISLGGYGWGVAGAALLQAQSVLDGVDGELARLRSQGSRLGQWLDTLSDDLSEFSFLIGSIIAVFHPYLRWFGIVGAFSYLLTKGIQYYALAAVYKTGDLQAFRWEVGGPEGWGTRLRVLFKHDFLCLLILLLTLFGRLDLALLTMSAGSVIMCGALLRQILLWGLDLREKGMA